MAGGLNGLRQVSFSFNSKVMSAGSKSGKANAVAVVRHRQEVGGRFTKGLGAADVGEVVAKLVAVRAVGSRGRALRRRVACSACGGAEQVCQGTQFSPMSERLSSNADLRRQSGSASALMLSRRFQKRTSCCTQKRCSGQRPSSASATADDT